MKNESWVDEAWEGFLTDKWDKRPKNQEIVYYTSKDLYPYLEKYTQSGEGEIRIFHYGHEKRRPVLKRGIIKIPITRSKWALVKRPGSLSFSEPTETGKINSETLTDGMKIILHNSIETRTNPGETSLLAIAKHVGVINDFYDLKDTMAMFTGGRQNALGCELQINGLPIDLSKAQVEIDGGFEGPKTAVIVEMKSSLKQDNFDPNQCLIPWLKWKKLLTDKKVYSMVLLCEIKNRNVEYWAYNLDQENNNSPFEMKITKGKKYILKF